jgi:hypothetical protein
MGRLRKFKKEQVAVEEEAGSAVQAMNKSEKQR